MSRRMNTTVQTRNKWIERESEYGQLNGIKGVMPLLSLSLGACPVHLCLLWNGQVERNLEEREKVKLDEILWAQLPLTSFPRVSREYANRDNKCPQERIPTWNSFEARSLLNYIFTWFTFKTNYFLRCSLPSAPWFLPPISFQSLNHPIACILLGLITIPELFVLSHLHLSLLVLITSHPHPPPPPIISTHQA